MHTLSVAVVVGLHILFWGLGLAWLITPSRWLRFWPVWVAPAGIALQSAVVWVVAHTSITGTNAYAWGAEMLPLSLLVLGWRRVKPCRAAPRRFGVLGGIMLFCLIIITLPLDRAGNHHLTTASMGSCDAADYAAGARTFKEFSASDHLGFMGQTEVVQVGSARTFFEFWLKLNHFTPSALIALNGSVFDLEPWQITGLCTLVFVVLVQPMVFWLARTTLGFGAGAALWLTLIYGVSPLTWYAAYHVAPAQIIAAMGIALVTWCGQMLWRERSKARAGLSYGGLLVVAYAIIWGAYNFVVIVCLVPTLACIGGWTISGGEWKEFWRWLRRMMVPLGIAGLFFTERVTGLAERFLLFRETDFGWRIHPLMPEGWLGLVKGTGLQPWENPVAWALSGIVLLMLTVAWFRCTARRPREAWRIVAFLIPVLLGYGYLQWRGWHLHNNASYDAYKLFAVFYPVLLVGFCPWLIWLSERGVWRALAVGMMIIVLAGNLYAIRLFALRLGEAPLVVEPTLAEVQKIESMAQITSVNLLVSDFWTRLWVNSFLLRKPQYLREHTYEGRLNTPLRGEWDLNGGIVQVKLPSGDWKRVNQRFSLTRVDSPWHLRASLGDGWYGTEVLRGRRTRRWNWSRGNAALVVENPHAHPLRVVLHLAIRSISKRDLQVWIGRRHLCSVLTSQDLQNVSVPPISVPPGRVTIDLVSRMAPAQAGPGDPRLLGFAIFGVEIEVLPDEVSEDPRHE